MGIPFIGRFITADCSSLDGTVHHRTTDHDMTDGYGYDGYHRMERFIIGRLIMI